MATTRTWAIKGVSDRTRDAAHEAAQAEGLTVGEWIDKALARAAEETTPFMPSYGSCLARGKVEIFLGTYAIDTAG